MLVGYRSIRAAFPTPSRNRIGDASFLNTVDAWAERTLAEIETWDDLMPSDEKNARGLEKIRQLPVDTPAEALKDVSIPPMSQMRSRS
jgi:hypothetical protein